MKKLSLIAFSVITIGCVMVFLTDPSEAARSRGGTIVISKECQDLKAEHLKLSVELETQKKASAAVQKAHEKAVKDFGSDTENDKKVLELWDSWEEELKKEERIQKTIEKNWKKMKKSCSEGIPAKE